VLALHQAMTGWQYTRLQNVAKVKSKRQQKCVRKGVISYGIWQLLYVSPSFSVTGSSDADASPLRWLYISTIFFHHVTIIIEEVHCGPQMFCHSPITLCGPRYYQIKITHRLQTCLMRLQCYFVTFLCIPNNSGWTVWQGSHGSWKAVKSPEIHCWFFKPWKDAEKAVKFQRVVLKKASHTSSNYFFGVKLRTELCFSMYDGHRQFNVHLFLLSYTS